MNKRRYTPIYLQVSDSRHCCTGHDFSRFEGARPDQKGISKMNKWFPGQTPTGNAGCLDETWLNSMRRNAEMTKGFNKIYRGIIMVLKNNEFPTLRKKWLCLFIFYLFLASAMARAQSNSQKGGIQSPEAASLGRYGDIPVGYYTGVPDITVPVYTIHASGGFTLPITLSYHASGIQVNQIAGWVGLGWALNAGGVITRTVRGLPDDAPNGYLETYQYLYEELYGNYYWPTAPEYAARTGGCDSDDLPCLVQAGYADTEPDIYFFNFNGYSGKMFSGPWGNGIMPYQNLKITGNPVSSEWTVTTEDGTKYIFGSSSGSDNEIENVTQLTEVLVTKQGGATSEGSSSLRTYKSAWYLREIHPANSDEVIRFNYTLHHTDSRNLASAYGYVEKRSENQQLTDYHIISDGETWGFANTTQTTLQQNTIAKPVLASIETNSETIQFVSDTLRSDKPFDTKGLRKLSEIKIYDKQGDLKKSIRLDYGYFNQGQTDAQRLRLDAVTEASPDGTDGPSYHFNYYTGQNLPIYGSYDKDFWGYYNAAGNSNSALPAIDSLGISGANRKPSWPAMQADMLTSITYPTGGHTDFTWEPNDYSTVGGHVLSNNELQSEYVSQSTTAEYHQLAPDQYDSGEPINSDDEVEKDFTINGTSNVDVNIKIQWPIKWQAPYIVIVSTADVKIKNSSGTTVQEFAYPVNAQDDNTTNQQISLPPGSYEILMNGIEVCSSCDVTWGNLSDVYYTVTARWSDKEVNPSLPLYRTGGGVRVKTISTYSGASGGAPEITNFNYRLDSNPSRSSGVIVAEPECYFGINIPYAYTTFQRFSNSLTALGSLDGRSVGYSEVKVTYGTNGEGGSKIFHYTTAGDYPDIRIIGSPGNPLPLASVYNEKALNWSATNNGWRRGHLTMEEDYNSNNVLVRRKSYKYDFHMQGLSLLDGDAATLIDTTSTSPLVSVLRGSSYFFPGNYSYGTSGLGISDTWHVTYALQNPYYLVAGWSSPSQVTVDTYNGTGEKVESRKRYVYEEAPSSKALGQLREEVDSTANQKRVTVYKYAHEQSQYSGMQSLHMFSQPYSISVEDGAGHVKSRHWTLWSLFNGHWQPQSQWIWNGTGTPPADPN